MAPDFERLAGSHGRSLVEHPLGTRPPELGLGLFMLKVCDCVREKIAASFVQAFEPVMSTTRTASMRGLGGEPQKAQEPRRFRRSARTSARL